MPLIHRKSKKAFGENVATEMQSGKPKDQSLAIAYSIKRQGKKKKMARGGSVEITAPEEKRIVADDKTPEEMEMLANGGAIDFKDEVRSDIDNDEASTDEDMIAGKRVMRDQERRAGGKMSNADDAMDDRDEDMIRMSDGGMPYDGDMDEEPPHSIAEAVMRKRKALMMAEGGQVDLDEESEESSANPNSYDRQNMLAAKKEMYDDDQISSDPMDSNERGDELDDEDSHDMVSVLRRKIRSTRGR